MERDADRTDEGRLEGSPLGSFSERVTTPDLLSEGPVRFLLVSGDQDDGAWGLVGSFWLSIDGERGGFFVSPQSLWRGSEMVRSFKSARARGWSRRRHLRLLAGRGGHLGLVHDRPAAARGQPVPGRPAGRARCSALRAAAVLPLLPGDQDVSRLRSLALADDALLLQAGPSGDRPARTRPSACAAACWSTRAGSGSTSSAAWFRSSSSSPDACAPSASGRSSGGRPSPSTLCS